MLHGDAAALHTAKKSSGVDASAPEITAAFAELQDEESKGTDWLVASCERHRSPRRAPCAGRKTDQCVKLQGSGCAAAGVLRGSVAAWLGASAGLHGTPWRTALELELTHSAQRTPPRPCRAHPSAPRCPSVAAHGAADDVRECTATRPSRYNYIDAPGSKTTLQLEAKGDGGLAGLTAALKDDAVAFAVCAFNSGGRRRAFFLSWQGEEAGGMVKGRSGMHRQGVLNAFEGVAADMSATERADLEAAAVTAKLSAACGGADVTL